MMRASVLSDVFHPILPFSRRTLILLLLGGAFLLLGICAALASRMTFGPLRGDLISTECLVIRVQNDFDERLNCHLPCWEVEYTPQDQSFNWRHLICYSACPDAQHPPDYQVNHLYPCQYNSALPSFVFLPFQHPQSMQLLRKFLGIFVVLGTLLLILALLDWSCQRCRSDHHTSHDSMPLPSSENSILLREDDEPFL